MLNTTHFLVATTLVSSFAVSTVLDDSDSDGRAMSEFINLVSNTNSNLFKHFPISSNTNCLNSFKRFPNSTMQL